MKKWGILLIVVFCLSGCQPDISELQDTTVITQMEESNLQTVTSDPVIAESTAPVAESDSEAPWLVGHIGLTPIQMELTVEMDQVRGSFRIDADAKPIPLSGTLEPTMKDYAILTLNAESGEEMAFKAIYWSADYIQGFKQVEDSLEPFYVLKKGSSVTKPNPPSAYLSQWEGVWYGLNDTYYSGTDLKMMPLFDNLVFYSLMAYNGAASGALEGFAVIDNREAVSLFDDYSYTNPSERVRKVWSFDGENLHLESNAYDYMCGMGVSFDAAYGKNKRNISVPTAMEVGIVDNEVEEKRFKALVKEEYTRFIDYTAFVVYDPIDWNGASAKVGQSYLRGLPAYCIYLMTENHQYVAAYFDDYIGYYTDDLAYSNVLPEPIRDWAERWGTTDIRMFYEDLTEVK